MRAAHDKNVEWMKKKHGRVKDEFSVPDEVKEYSECKVFKSDPVMKPEEPSGPVIVCDEDEDLHLSTEE